MVSKVLSTKVHKFIIKTSQYYYLINAFSISAESEKGGAGSDNGGARYAKMSDLGREVLDLKGEVPDLRSGKIRLKKHCIFIVIAFIFLFKKLLLRY